MIPFIAIVQGVLFLAHALVFETVNYFWGKPGIPHLLLFSILVSISFVPASMLVWRYTHFFAWGFYRLAAIWLGCLSFFFWASIVCWAVHTALQLYGLFGSAPRAGDYGRTLLLASFSLAAVAAVLAFANAAWLRVTEIAVVLPGLPDSWKGRTAVLAGDLHLGPVRGFGFSQRVVRLAAKLKPDIVFLTGDFYDGTAVDEVRMASAWKEFSPTHGIYYVTGNHEEFSDRTKYLNAIEGAGIRILRNEKVVVNGLQIAGVLYGEGHQREAFRLALERMNLERAGPAILLSHVPQFYDVAEEAGISLKLSGHTHNGQLFPWNWVARRVHGRFVYGLNEFKRMLVYTTSGAGTWGPPMRLATRAELVLIKFR
jgi:predicted MPP superfamily phosphohydrolase